MGSASSADRLPGSETRPSTYWLCVLGKTLHLAVLSERSAQSHSAPSERWRSQELSGPLGLTFQPVIQDPQVQVVRGNQENSVDLLSGQSA